MEYVNGDTLRKILSKKKSLNVQDSIYILKKILLVIQDIHNLPHKLIHRDLKPENIMLSGDLTEIKIFDFGIAMTLKNENLTDTIFDQESFFTKDDEIFGTAYYLTPQILEVRQFKNDKEKFNEILNKIGVQFDFYALGIIFYEMLTGAKPFIIPEGKDESKVLNIAANYDIPIISEMNTPPEAENIILRLTASKNFNTKGE
jgi:serine/threonine-protein kinase